MILQFSITVSKYLQKYLRFHLRCTSIKLKIQLKNEIVYSIHWLFDCIVCNFLELLSREENLLFIRYKELLGKGNYTKLYRFLPQQPNSCFLSCSDSLTSDYICSL